jgi:hypothetical protein
MKALITAFALLSFVAASTIPSAAQAQTQAPTEMHKTVTKKAKKKHVASTKKAHHKTVAKKKVKSPVVPAHG